MTTGIQDAANLGWKLAAQVRGWAPAGLLDTYHAERHPVGARMLSFTRAQGGLLDGGDQAAALRDLMGELLTHEQTLEYIVDRLFALDIRYHLDGPAAHPLVGRWAPDLALSTATGDTRLATLLRPARPVLLDLTPDGHIREAADAWGDRLTTVTARTAEPLAGLLERPDGYVAWAAADDPDLDGLRRALHAWLGAPGNVLASVPQPLGCVPDLGTGEHRVAG
jgi:hypothetical protein